MVSYGRKMKAYDRIQAIMSETQYLPLPPIHIVPYAVALSLTGAYRGWKEGHKNLVHSKQDIISRCEILESLSKYWQNTEMVAIMGRKALLALQEPGVKRHAVVNLTAGLNVDDGPTPVRPGLKEIVRTSEGNRLQINDVLGGDNEPLNVLSNATLSTNTVHFPLPQNHSVVLTHADSASVSAAQRPVCGSETLRSLPAPAGHTIDSSLHDHGTDIYQFQDVDSFFNDYFELGFPGFPNNVFDSWTYS